MAQDAVGTLSSIPFADSLIGYASGTLTATDPGIRAWSGTALVPGWPRVWNGTAWM